MTNVEMNIWGRTFDLEVEYDCGDNEKVPQNQIDAVEKTKQIIQLIKNKNIKKRKKKKKK